ncbi:hypothetical protein RJ641_010723 [Dillenia turbinata]|uniref:Uncharacterized protein n=1 Tax=Dillenia turbinata TaxID=194707 RepID=A0AAN8VB59_9MAGN
MSRCFPYPPPGYVVKCTRDEALIESLKIDSSGIKIDSGNSQLQKEAEKAKKERRKERKKEKREEKKRRRDEENKKHGHEKGHKHERSHVDHKEGDFQKRKENETEQWEKSTLTEEHGQAFGSHNLCNSTESTLNSDKRQKQKQSSPADCKPNHGSIIRIRLPLQRHKDPEVLPNTEQPCSSSISISISGRINNFVQEVHEFPRSSTEPPDCLQQECSTSGQIGPELVSRPSKEKSRPGTSQTDAHSQMVESASLSCSRSRVPHPVEMQFRDLMWKWTPHSLQSDCAGLYDEGWLFETKLDFDSGAKRFKTTDGSCCANDTLMPSASYLPEVDIYALPFTVPF